MVIIEGPDGAGKSSLASELCNKFGFAYWHAGVPQPNENVFETYTKVVLDAIRKDRDIVFDRLNLCELIYGEVMRDGDRFYGDHGRVLIERLLRAQRAQFVVCLPPIEVVIKNWSFKRRERWDPEKRTGDYVNAEDKIREIYRRYDEATKARQYHRYDYTIAGSFDRVMSSCLYIPTFFTALPKGTIGSPLASHLIVGEQVNTRSMKYDLPFYSPALTSRYLNNCLAAAGYTERNLAFTNAVRRHGVVTDVHRHRRSSTGHRDLKRVISHLPNFRIAIALGETAQRVCRHQKIPYVGIPHPSFQSRFQNGHTSTYIDTLRELRSV